MGNIFYYLDQKYGVHDWYEWAMANWKCKWNAFDMEREGNVLKFFTANAGVPNLMLTASEKFPEIEMDYEFADEYFGYNLGRYTFKAGEVIALYEPENFSVEAKILAKQILGWDEPEEDKE